MRNSLRIIGIVVLLAGLGWLARAPVRSMYLEPRNQIEQHRVKLTAEAERYRAGEAISSAPAESAVNQVIAKRMVKKQQMRWTPAGAHRLPQIRTRVLDHRLDADIAQWHPTNQPLAA